MPEHSQATVNYRIAVHQSVGQLRSDLAQLLAPIAERFNLSLDAFDETQRTGRSGVLELKTLAELEPAPLSPTSGDTWDRLAGTIRHVWQHAGRGALYVVPSLMGARDITACSLIRQTATQIQPRTGYLGMRRPLADLRRTSVERSTDSRRSKPATA